MKSLFGWLLRSILLLVLICVLSLTALIFIQVPIDLTGLKDPIEKFVGKAFGRSVNIEESIVITTSLKPVFTLRGLEIGNPEGFSEETFMHLESVRIQVELLPLLSKKIHVSEFSVKKLHINLEERKNGEVNWAINNDGDRPEQTKTNHKVTEPAAIEPPSFDIVSDTVVIKQLSLVDIDIRYTGPDDSEPVHYQVEKCIGYMLPGQPLVVDISGNIRTFPYILEISIASLDEFLQQNMSWVKINAEIAETNLMFSGNVNLAEAHRSLTLQAEVFGENLKSLNNLLELDLPPISSYGLKAKLFVKDKHLEMENLIVKTETSVLTGSALIVKKEEKLAVEINLHSPQIQINDFIFEDWSWAGDEIKAGAMDESIMPGTSREKGMTDPEQQTNGLRGLIDPQTLKDLDSKLSIRADKVLSGVDDLGSGHLQATLRNGRIAIEPIELNLPGGSIKVSATFKPGGEQSDASLAVIVNNFDIGILARRNKPDAKMEGLINLDIDLKSSAASLDQMLANGNGYLDFSGQLKNLDAGIIDIWAVNLIAVVVASTDVNQSQVNCAVGRWTVEDGLLTPDVFFIDTSKIRICGKGQVNLKRERIDMVISPSPKRPEFFSLATPLEIHGTFSDINYGLNKAALIGTVITFITSPVIVPIRRVFEGRIPEDGSDACSVALGSENRADSNVSGCR